MLKSGLQSAGAQIVSIPTSPKKFQKSPPKLEKSPKSPKKLPQKGSNSHLAIGHRHMAIRKSWEKSKKLEKVPTSSKKVPKSPPESAQKRALIGIPSQNLMLMQIPRQRFKLLGKGRGKSGKAQAGGSD
jgi:hypothetical protein